MSTILLCNVHDCLYCSQGGFCIQDYPRIKNGTCEWLINNPSYRNPNYKPFEPTESPITPKVTDKETNS